MVGPRPGEAGSATDRPDDRLPVVVSYCPLCQSGFTAVRRVDRKATRFGVSGLLRQNALVVYDEATASLWSQLAATAVNGGRLETVPSTLTTWGE